MDGAKAKEPPKIRVVVRKRPLFGKEITRNDRDILTVVGNRSLIVQELKEKVDTTKYIEEHSFTFDNVFEHTDDNNAIYNECILPLVTETFNGAKTTCFAYGQTGSGKTFTMMGATDGSVSGMYTLASYDIIDLLEAYEGLDLYVSFYEIYCGKLYDLLNKHQHVECREDAKQRVNIINLTETKVTAVEEIMDIIHGGLKCRTSGTTGANAESSRSHAILTYSIKHGGKLYSKMSFIDLAGSERGADVIDTGKKTKQDGAEINKSLLALKECIRALDQAGKGNRLPFRGSKLTQVLKDSFIGKCKTTMIANVSPALSCCEPTLNTLRYADRVKELKKDKALKDRKADDGMMLARQSGNTKIIEIDQKTGLPLDQCQELAADFKPTLKKPLDPAAALAAKRAARGAGAPNATPAQAEPEPVQQVAPTKIGGGSKSISGSGIGGGSRIGGGMRKVSTQEGVAPPQRQPKHQQQFQPKQNNYTAEQDDFMDDIPDIPQTRPLNSGRGPGRNPNMSVQNMDANRTIPKNQLQNLMANDNRNQSLQEFDEQFDNNLGGDDNLIDDDMMDDDALADLGDGLMDTQENLDYDDAGDDQLPDMDEVEFNQQHQQAKQNKLEDIDLDRDSGEDFEGDDEDLFQNIQQDVIQAPNPNRQQIIQKVQSQAPEPTRQMQRIQKPTAGSQSIGGARMIGGGSKIGGGGGIGGGLKAPTRENALQQPSRSNNHDRRQATSVAPPQLQNQESSNNSNQAQTSQVNSFKAKLLKQKQDRESKMGGAVDHNASVVSVSNTASSSQLGAGLRNKARAGMVQSTTNANPYSRETPAKKGFFGSVIDQSTNNIGGTPGSKLQRPGLTSHKSSHSAIKMSSNNIGGRVNQPTPQIGRVNAGGGTAKSGLKGPTAQTQVKVIGPVQRQGLGENIPTFKQLEKKYQDNHEQLGEDHEKLIEQILEDEEMLIFKHNASCKESIQIVEQEMAILKDVDKPGSDVEQYIEKLDAILLSKISKMEELREKVVSFYKNIKTEQELNKLFQQIQSDLYEEQSPGQ